MISGTRLSDELIAERRIEAFREKIESGLQWMADSKRFRRVACHAYTGLCGVWEIPENDAATLLGITPTRYRKWVANDGEPMDVQVLEKISCLLGIYKDLGTLYSGHLDRTARWFKYPNPQLDGQAPYDVLAGAEPPTFHTVRRFVAAMMV